MGEAAEELLPQALEALGRGDVPAAVALLERAADEHGDPAAHQLLGGLAYDDDRLDDARHRLEQAFRGFRTAGDLRAAARTATLLAEIHGGSLGNPAAARGWSERARRLLEAIGPCVEWGYWELARLACDRPDADDLARSAARALALAVEHGDPELEVRALADGGLALVTQGRVREGFSQLDEALASLTSGDVRDPYIMGTTLCALLSSCDRVGDVERAMEWIRLVQALVLDPTGGRPRVLGTHCKVAFGGVLCAAGRWDEAEAALLAALGPSGSVSVGHRMEATARLAELRAQQGRLEEAAELLAPIEDAVVAAGPLAMVHLARGEAELAAAVLRRAVRQLVGDVLRGGPLVGALVEVELARGDVDAAAEAAALLRAMSAAVDAPVATALASLAEARVARASARPDDAVTSLGAALDHLASGERPFLLAAVHLELAEAHAAAGDTGSAIASARSAHAVAQRLDAAALCDRASATLRRLGATAPRPAPRAGTLAGLTAREAEVLEGLRAGDSNAQIAARLYLSPKTVEHHVGRVLAKLGVRSRAEAAAVAAAHATNLGG